MEFLRNNSTLFFCLLLLLSWSGMEAQYPNPYGRQRSSIPQTQHTPREPEPMTAEEIVSEQMPKIKEVIDLTPFEEAILSTTLTKYLQKRMHLQLMNLDEQKYFEGMKQIMEDQDAELKASLPEDKYNAFVDLQKEGMSKMKKKKKREKKKKKQE